MARRRAAVVVCLALGAILTACGTARRGVPLLGPFELADDPVLVAGEQVFMRNCHQCHPQGESGLAPALNNVPLPAAVVRFQVRNGIGAMPAFSEQDISEAQLEALVAYIDYLRHRGVAP